MCIWNMKTFPVVFLCFLAGGFGFNSNICTGQNGIESFTMFGVVNMTNTKLRKPTPSMVLRAIPSYPMTLAFFRNLLALMTQGVPEQ